ncbi:hypothetical protein NDU88_004426 [Pleurodeles waltl]|uniref:Uncharacterized protein n=1 Tax=Pleurodeles waltl TaxID=8319 RepID=A0AAV7T8G9_PLEWA|nr:hypothetical protein NDU88_004426 [Pleurodeles waltl]
MAVAHSLDHLSLAKKHESRTVALCSASAPLSKSTQRRRAQDERPLCGEAEHWENALGMGASEILSTVAASK